ncbi:SCO2322 family protein [Kitasatospora sp. NPDC058170]|uniref:SCO2322 family protein n=1 Tax=Kitasatospora sp. NPDC058170 TaxID=3346364 RepID=UPI0036DA5FAE
MLIGLLAGLFMVGAAPAQAAGYRYWSFWKWSGDTWTYQQQGPSVHVPPDGSTDGWRFAVSPDGGQDAARPGATGDFGAICADTPGQPGRKRVAVVLDFGTGADAPSGEAPPGPRTACATVPTSATSAEVLAAVAPPLRYDTNGLLCAIAGYPRAGCGDQLGGGGAGGSTGSSATAPGGSAGSANSTGPGGSGNPGSSGDDPGSGPDIGLIAGGALVAALAAGAVWQARRRRS